MKRSFHIAVLPGDGIGPEIAPVAVRILEAVGRLHGLAFTMEEGSIGGCAIDRFGVPLPQETLDLVRRSDSVLMGAVGGPKWDSVDSTLRPERALLGLREALGLFANLRPAVLFPDLIEASPLKANVISGTDLLVVRELTGGIYFGNPKGIKPYRGGERGVNTEVYTTKEIERIANVAFRSAQKRRKQVTSVDKANVLESSQLWRRVVTRISEQYPDVTLCHMYVDNCAMQLIRDPRQFDVILTNNMFGDILSDEAAMLTGSIGMIPSASLGSKALGLFEPIHGAAPDIAGRNVGNPIAMILSASMMLRYSFSKEEAAQDIEEAVKKVLAKGYRTQDLQTSGVNSIGTREMGDLIVNQLLEA